MACLAGVRQACAPAERLLSELAGWQLDAQTIRRHRHAEAARARAPRAERATAAALAATPGAGEVPSDAGKANTGAGWRAGKVAAFARRRRGEPACAADRGRRELPAPGVRSVVAAIAEASTLGERWGAEARRWALTDPRACTALADGAAWIGNVAAQQFPGAAGVLDSYHGAEHLAAAARRVFGEGRPAARAQAEQGRTRLLEDGYAGVTEGVGTLSGQIAAGGDGAVLGTLWNYLGSPQGRLAYALGLRRGQALGSGLVEGSSKQRLKKRLKQTGARGKAAQVGPFVEPGAVASGPEWQAFWN
jgi:hypothetical protein